MKCHHCKRTIASGAEAQKMICGYLQDDGACVYYGHGMHAGALSKATGRLAEAWHHKCYHVVRKREARGDAITGRVMGDSWLPSSYQVGAFTLTSAEVEALDLDLQRQRHYDLARRVERLHQCARNVGKPVGDPEVTEAFRASEHAGPYRHQHRMPLETYQLLAHLRYAHGYGEDVHRDAALVHAGLHAGQALAEIQERRQVDPDYTPAEDRDWRDQHSVDI